MDDEYRLAWANIEWWLNQRRLASRSVRSKTEERKARTVINKIV
jgi:hypothetical protein